MNIQQPPPVPIMTRVNLGPYVYIRTLMNTNRAYILLLQDEHTQEFYVGKYGTEVAKEYERRDKLPNHPNLICYTAIHTIRDKECIIMPYYPSGDLFQVIDMKQSLSYRLIWQFIIDITSALDTLHNAGWVHLDLSLENILCDSDNHAYITDFEFIQHYQNVPTNWQKCGKWGYLAPELLRNGHQHIEDFRQLDVFAFGVIIFILLCGVPPLNQDKPSPKVYYFLKQWDAITLLYYYSPESKIPPSFVELLNHTLMYTPEKRWTMKQVKQYLKL